MVLLLNNKTQRNSLILLKKKA